MKNRVRSGHHKKASNDTVQPTKRHIRAGYALARRLADGQALRETVPRAVTLWKRPDKRRDPIDILKASNRGRLPELVPSARADARSPFTFLRGSSD
jgi:hypothetical protein